PQTPPLCLRYPLDRRERPARAQYAVTGSRGNQMALAGGDDDRPVQVRVEDGDAPGEDDDARAVAAGLEAPARAAHGRRRVAAPRAEAALAAADELADHGRRGGGRAADLPLLLRRGLRLRLDLRARREAAAAERQRRHEARLGGEHEAACAERRLAA